MWWLAIKSDLLDLACDPFMFDKLHRTHQRERRNSSNSSNDDNGMPSLQNKRASYIFIIPGVCASVVIFSLIPKNRLLHHILFLSLTHIHTHQHTVSLSCPISTIYSVCVSLLVWLLDINHRWLLFFRLSLWNHIYKAHCMKASQIHKRTQNMKMA